MLGAIEASRRELDRSSEEVAVDMTEHWPDWRTETTVGEWVRAAAVDPPRGRLLFALVRALRPSRCVELGTNMGISAAYIASALTLNGDGRLISLDSIEQATERATRHHRDLGLDRSEFRTGLFSEHLAPALSDLGGCDFAFVDGDHHEEPTLAYYEQIAAMMGEGDVIVFDNVAGEAEMERAWARIQAHPRSGLAITFEALGVVVLR